MIKIDLQKAHDTMDWEFIGEVFRGLQFPSMFVEQVMACITSTKFYVMVNSSMEGYFSGCQGLCQGDPISPLLFVLSMEYMY